MILNADTLLAHLKQKVRPLHSDDSRHLICLHCNVRTRLNILGDGRRKCTVCGAKFRIHKITEEKKLQQCADSLLGFCLDFSPKKTALLTQHRYRLVRIFYNYFRQLITEEQLRVKNVIKPLDTLEDIDSIHHKGNCQWCKNTMRVSHKNTPVFGIQFNQDHEVYIDPLTDKEAVAYFKQLPIKTESTDRFAGYAGYVCCNKLHKFIGFDTQKNITNQFWTWKQERVRSHYSIWRKNKESYLKELEWKFNHRLVGPEAQALAIIELMPIDFIRCCSL